MSRITAWVPEMWSDQFSKAGPLMSKLFAIAIGFIGPLLIWALVYAAARGRVFDLQSMSRVLTAWRLITLGAATSILTCHFVTSPPQSGEYFRYFWCVLLLSTNLFLPQQWLKKQIGSPERSAAVSSEKNVIPSE
jgi:hypothetical protein